MRVQQKMKISKEKRGNFSAKSLGFTLSDSISWITCEKFVPLDLRACWLVGLKIPLLAIFRVLGVLASRLVGPLTCFVSFSLFFKMPQEAKHAGEGSDRAHHLALALVQSLRELVLYFADNRRGSDETQKYPPCTVPRTLWTLFLTVESSISVFFISKIKI